MSAKFEDKGDFVIRHFPRRKRMQTLRYHWWKN